MGCFTKDELLSQPIKNKFAIINNNNSTDPDDGTGHWTLIYNAKSDQGILFDSMGALPADTIVKYMKRSRKPLVYSNQQVQALYGSESCGWYCVYVALQLQDGRSFKQIMKDDFSADVARNEFRLREWYISLDKKMQHTGSHNSF